MLTDGYVDNEGVSIHYIHIGTITPAEMPFIIVPGMVESAEDYVEHFEGSPLSDIVLVSLRGRGKSDAPEQGYSFQEQLSDVAAVIEHLELHHYVIIGFSVGASFAIATTLSHPEQAQGLGIIDYAPHYPAIPASWIGEVTRPGQELLPVHVAQAIVEDGERVVMSRELPEIECPVLVVRGTMEGSLLPEEIAKLYTDRIPHCTMLILDRMAHDPFSTPTDDFINALVTLRRAASSEGASPF